MQRLLQDLRFGSRLLWRDRGFTITAIATMALCIGANTAIFSVLNSVVLSPLPVPEPAVHSLAVGPGTEDVHKFLIQAVHEGEYLLSAQTSFEVHVGYPGPAYWGSAASEEALPLRVLPSP